MPEVRLVGENIEGGVYPTRKALEIAEELELDLVEISPNATPPVCKVIDYKKFLYEQKKRDKEMKAKATKVVIKEIRIFLKSLEENSKNINAIPFIYVTHQIEEIISSITHVAILDNGEIVAQGNKYEVLTNENLSKFYEIDVKIEWSNNRPWLIVK